MDDHTSLTLQDFIIYRRKALATLRATEFFGGVTRCNLLRATSQKENSILLLQLLRAMLQEKL